MGCFLAACFVVAWAQAAPSGGDWSVRRNNRRSIMVRRFQIMLERSPYSGYAFRRLIGLYRSKNARKVLLRRYRLKLERAPRNTNLKIIVARLLLHDRQYASALPLFEQVGQQKPNWLDIKLSKAQCQLGLGQGKAALRTFRQIIPALKRPSRKKRLLRRMLKTSLRAKDQASYQFAMRAIKQLKWSREDRILLSRLLNRYQKNQAALDQLNAGVKSSRGRMKLRLLTEIIRIQTETKAYKAALVSLKKARKVGALYRWVAWELQMKEIDIYRKMKQLPVLVSKLDRKWHKTRDTKKLTLLARLYDELKVRHMAETLYLKVLKIKPSSREARLQLIRWYTKRKEPTKVRPHLLKLIKYNHAAPKHYFRLINEDIKTSGRPSLARWTPSWKRIYKRYCRRGTTYRKRQRYRRRYYRNLWLYQRKYRYRRRRRYYGYNRYGDKSIRFRCSAKAWERYRQRRWKLWRQQSAPTEIKAYNTALKYMRLCVRRFPRDWNSLYDLESMFARYGASSDQKRAFRLLFRSTGSQLARIQTMEQLLHRLGKGAQLKQLLKRGLRSRWLSPKAAVDLATYAYEPKRSGPKSKAIQSSARKGKRWKRSMCPSIRGLLKRVMRRLPKSYPQREPDLALAMGALLWRCGDRSRRLEQTLRTLEALASGRPKVLRSLLKTYIQFQAQAPFRRLLKQPFFAEQMTRVLPILKESISNDTPPDQIRFVLTQTRSLFDKNPAILAQFANLVCQHASLCRQTKPAIQALIRESTTPPKLLIKVLTSVARHALFQSERRIWLPQLIKKYQSNIRALQQLAEADAIFEYPSRFRRLHQKLLVEVLQKRQFAPARLRHWGQMFQGHLKLLSPTSRRNKVRISRLLKGAERFPSLYRQILAYMQLNYRYRRAFGWKKLKEWLTQHQSLPDLALLEVGTRYVSYGSYRRRWLTKQQVWLQKITEKIQAADSAGWMASFAHKHQLRLLFLTSLMRLAALRPNDPPLLRRLALSLEREPSRRHLAQGVWRKWFRLQPHLLKPSGVARLAASCCADRASSQMAIRLLQESMRQFGQSAAGRSSLWPHIMSILPKVEADLQQTLLSWLATQPLHHTKLKKLAQWSHTHKQKKAAVDLYRILLKRQPNTPAKEYRRLASLLDEQGRFAEAMPHWLQFLQKTRRTPASFFGEQARQFRKKKRPKLAMVAMYRAYKSAPTTAPPTASADPIKRWSQWALRQGKSANQCLQDLNSQMEATPAAALSLWRLNVGYNGPLGFYPRCQWALSESFRQTMLPPLLALLKKRTNLHMMIVGSGDPNTEPDAGTIAKQRAITLRDALLKAGIADDRIQVSHFQGLGLCQLRTSTPALCQQYRRQITIAMYESQQAPPTLTSVVVPFKAFRKQDADRDRVPDYLDQCPLEHAKHNNRPTYKYKRRKRYRGSYGRSWLYGRRRRYRRYRRRYGRGREYRPWVLSAKSTKAKAASQKATGCPNNPSLAIKPITGNELALKRQIIFASSYSYRIHRTSYPLLEQVAALMKLAPQLGKLEIRIHPRKDDRASRRTIGRRGYRRRSFLYRYRRYRRRYRRKRYNPRLLGSNRAYSIEKFLKRRGVPHSRLSTHIDLPISVKRAQKKRLPYTSFKLLDRTPPSKP